LKVTDVELARYLRVVRAERKRLEREVARMEAENRTINLEVRVGGVDEYANAIWALIEDELEDFPEARESVRLRLDEIRGRHSSPKATGATPGLTLHLFENGGSDE
jgi:hypothetical protein